MPFDESEQYLPFTLAEFPAQVLAVVSSNGFYYYTWQEQTQSQALGGAPSKIPMIGGRSGSPTLQPAFEINNQLVAVPCYVKMRCRGGADTGLVYEFEAPVASTPALPDECVNLQTGTTYTYQDSDRGKLVSHSNVSAIAGTLPQANATTFIDCWWMDVENRGAGTLTITPTTSTIDGATSIAIGTGHGCRICSWQGNYYTQRGMGGGTNIGPVTYNIGPIYFGGWNDTTGPSYYYWPTYQLVGCFKVAGQPPAAATTAPTLLACPSTAPTGADGGAGGSLAPGIYHAKYTYVSTTGGLESPPSPESGSITVTNSKITVTLPGALPAGIATWNLYLTPANGANNSETFQVSGGSGTSVTYSGPYAAGAAPPAAGVIPAGDYYAKYTWVDDVLAESSPSNESTHLIGVTLGQGILATVPALPAKVQSWNLYLTLAGGATNTETLVYSGTTATVLMYTGTGNPASAFPFGKALPSSGASATQQACFQPPDCCGEPTWTGDFESVLIDRCSAYPQWWVQMDYPSGTNWLPICGTNLKGQVIAGDTDGEATPLNVGSDGQVLTADAASALGIKWGTVSGGSAYGSNLFSFEQVGTSPDCWYQSGLVTYAQFSLSNSFSKDVIYAIPLVNTRGATIDKIEMYWNSVTGHAKVGLYRSTSATNLYPSTLLKDCGIMTAPGAPGAVQLSGLAAVLTADMLCWLCVVFDTNSTVVSSFLATAANTLGQHQVLGFPDGWGNDSQIAWSKSSTYATGMPGTFPASGTPVLSNAAIPIFRYLLSA